MFILGRRSLQHVAEDQGNEASWRIWRFPIIVVYPQIIHFNRIFHYKPTIWGHLHLWKPESYNGTTILGNTHNMGLFPENFTRQKLAVIGVTNVPLLSQAGEQVLRRFLLFKTWTRKLTRFAHVQSLLWFIEYHSLEGFQFLSLFLVASSFENDQTRLEGFSLWCHCNDRICRVSTLPAF